MLTQNARAIKMMRTVLTSLSVVLLTFGSEVQQAQTRPDLIIRHVTVVDVEHARTLVDQAVATPGSTIVAQSIRAVILRGTLYDRPALDRLLAETRQKVAAWNATAAP